MIRTFKTNQEQAVAAWINYLNLLRINKMLQDLHQQDINCDEAMKELKWAFDEVHKTLSSNRGGECGIHGFLAEVAEKGIYNARQLIDGLPADMEWLNDNGPSDLRRAGTEIQQKFYESDGLFSLGAVHKHLQKYPDFLAGGGKYQIPKEQYEQITRLYEMSEKEAYRQLSNSGEGLSLRQWRKVRDFFNHSNVKYENLEPSEIKYHEAQKGEIDNTIKNVKVKIKERDYENRQEIYRKSRPTFQGGAKAATAAGVIEGGTALCIGIANKLKSGKKLREFTEDDWQEIFNDAGISTVKGCVRGATIYALTSPKQFNIELRTNNSIVPAAVASSLVTAGFGVAEQVHLFQSGKICLLELIENSEIVCLDASVSALASLIGQALIPVPVLGAVIGNTVGSIIYHAVKNDFHEQERQLFDEYLLMQEKMDEKLQERYEVYISALRNEMDLYIELLDCAFDTDVFVAFDGSAAMAKQLGVPEEEILDCIEKIDEFFIIDKS